MKGKQRVVVIGANHRNTLGLVRSLGQKGIKVDLLLEPCNLRMCSLRFSKYISRIHYLHTITDILPVLHKHYWEGAGRTIVLCGTDGAMSFLDAHYDELKDKFQIFNALGLQGRINFFLDKANTFPVAKESGLSLIKTWKLSTGNSIPRDLTFPCLIKGSNSTKSSKSDMCVCQNVAELRTFMRHGVEYLVQEYIEKDYELDVVGFSYNHGTDIVLPAVVFKIRDYLKRQSCYVRLDDIKNYSGLDVAAIKKFICTIGYEGIFSVEFLCKGGKYYFLELNMRNDACGYVFTAAGANFPYMWYLYCCGLIPKDGTLSKCTVKTPFYMMSDVDFDNMREGKVDFFRWLNDLLTADGYFQFTWRDLLPFFHDILIRARHLKKRILNKL